MAFDLDPKLVINHLVNGNFAENLCRICLTPLSGRHENIFTMICKEDREYCIADILEEMCGIRFAETDNYSVCLKCFVCASNAYKFYLQTKYNNEILSFYIDELESNVKSVQLPDEITADSLCISLPYYKPTTEIFDYSIEGVTELVEVSKDSEGRKLETVDHELKVKIEDEEIKKEFDKDDIVIVMTEDGQQSFFQLQEDGNLVQFEPYKKPRFKYDNVPIKKARKKREPMTYKQCNQCPIKYRFVAKLREHMKTEHNVDLYQCKICQALIITEEDFIHHLQMHTNIYQCDICNNIFKKRDTITTHLKMHEKLKNSNTDKADQKDLKIHTCKMCGEISKSEEELKDHFAKIHCVKYTCYYCGRMYKGEVSFNLHIKKHEIYAMKHKQNDKKHSGKKQPIEIHKQPESKKFTCETCGRNFQGERALLWHNRLHTNERPYTCDVCGRGFVSLNRRNQHALCAHTVPTRRCPLCPALFHLRSMVNTHIKKVHLKAHKRRNRTMRHQDVFWNTEPVPIQELSVTIQNEILELQAAKENEEETVQYAYIIDAGDHDQ